MQHPIHLSNRRKEKSRVLGIWWRQGKEGKRGKGERYRLSGLGGARSDFALICVLIFICMWKGEEEGDGEGESPCNIHERRRGEDALHKR